MCEEQKARPGPRPACVGPACGALTIGVGRTCLVVSPTQGTPTTPASAKVP